MCEFLGYNVVTLKRVRIMNIDLSGLKPGQWRDLTDPELEFINNAVADSSKTKESSIDPNKRDDFVPQARLQNRRKIVSMTIRYPTVT